MAVSLSFHTSPPRRTLVSTGVSLPVCLIVSRVLFPYCCATARDAQFLSRFAVMVCLLGESRIREIPTQQSTLCRFDTKGGVCYAEFNFVTQDTRPYGPIDPTTGLNRYQWTSGHAKLE